MQGLFITATDTGVGKTEITAAIARVWRRQGRAFVVSKPVLTGTSRDQGDTARLANAAAATNLEAITPFVFAEAAAPPVAARAEGKTLTLEGLAGAIESAGEGAKLVEGVGGLLCPVTEEHTVADLVARLDLPVVVVARRSLGTLNHTLLTLEVARGRGLRVCGVVVNETAPVQDLATETNVAELARRASVPLLAVVPYHESGYQEEIPAIGAIDWWSLSQWGIQHRGKERQPDDSRRR